MEESSNKIVEKIIDSWKEVLSVTDISETDDFFQLGGDSLAAVIMLTLLRDEHGIDIPLRAVFECPQPLAISKHAA